MQALQAVTDLANDPQLHLEWDLEPGDIQVRGCARSLNARHFVEVGARLPNRKCHSGPALHPCGSEYRARLLGPPGGSPCFTHVPRPTTQLRTRLRRSTPQLLHNWNQLHMRTSFEDHPVSRAHVVCMLRCADRVCTAGVQLSCRRHRLSLPRMRKLMPTTIDIMNLTHDHGALPTSHSQPPGL